jgi:hypothetical protein
MQCVGKQNQADYSFENFPKNTASYAEGTEGTYP